MMARCRICGGFEHHCDPTKHRQFEAQCELEHEIGPEPEKLGWGGEVSVEWRAWNRRRKALRRAR